jgi:hypothetical protein
MLRSILAIIASYVVMFVLFMAIFLGLYIGLGTERVFQPDSYEVSTLWLALTLAGSFFVSLLGGWLCVTISGSWRVGQVFALIVLLLNAAQCFADLRRHNPDAPNTRAGEVSFRDGIELSVTPLWLHVVNPLVGGAGALLGARMKRRRNA